MACRLIERSAQMRREATCAHNRESEVVDVPNLAKLARAARADAWMVKPTDLEDLVARINELAPGRELT